MNKKIKGLLVVCGLALLTLSKTGLTTIMNAVDFYGEKTGACVVEEIDFLNEVYYALHEDLF